MSPSRLLFGFGLLVLLAPAPGLAQENGPVAQGDDLHARMRPLEALEAYQAALRADSSRYDALWKAAREAVDLGMLTGDDGARREWYLSAVDYARRAVAADSTGAEGYTWLGVALGRQALQEGPRTKVRLAREIRDAAQRALTLDPRSAGAHHVLGQWNAEIRRLGGLTRFAARHLLGAEIFDEADWDEAESHLRRATELEPTALIHHLELARVLLDRDRPDEARDELEQVLERPAREPIDSLLKQEAQELLQELG